MRKIVSDKYRCKAFTQFYDIPKKSNVIYEDKHVNNGGRCIHKALMVGYCVVHFKMFMRGDFD